MELHGIVTASHQHAGQAALRVMHGLQWRVPLFIELDEFHRSCVIDPNLSNEKGQRAPKSTGMGKGMGE